MTKPHLHIGIDPGVTTGLAVWDVNARDLVALHSLDVAQAFEQVRVAKMGGRLAHVWVEDARKRTWFGVKGVEALQGAGSIKRESAIWESVLQLLGVDYTMVSPQAKGSKLDAEQFRRLSGWSSRTSQHARDAAMLVIGR